MQSEHYIMLTYLAVGFLSTTVLCYLRRHHGGLGTLKFLACFAFGDLGLFFLAAFLWPLFFFVILLYLWSRKTAINSGDAANDR